MARRTLAGERAGEGIGLHTGRAATARCFGAPSGQGIVFRRMDLAGSPAIPARLAEVQSTERRTVLGQGEAAVQTVEHLLAAAAALQIDDLTVELDGPEPPIGDGSFAPYLTALQRGRHRRAAGRAGGVPGHDAVPAHRRRLHLRRGAGARAPAHHHDRVGASADRPADRGLRHHARPIRPGAGGGAHVRVPS